MTKSHLAGFHLRDERVGVSAKQKVLLCAVPTCGLPISYTRGCFCNPCWFVTPKTLQQAFSAAQAEWLGKGKNVGPERVAAARQAIIDHMIPIVTARKISDAVARARARRSGKQEGR